MGGTVAGSANVISANGGDGVDLYNGGTSANVVLGNLIGTDKNGAAKLGNSGNGVAIGHIPDISQHRHRHRRSADTEDNTIGGAAAGSANVISGNGGSGVYLVGSGTSGNVVLGNLIGTDKNGTVALGNLNGVFILGSATANTVGGAATGAANVISGNNGNYPDGKGVWLSGSGTSGNVVVGNLSGADIHGAAALGNTSDSVQIDGNATANTVGGTATGAANVMTGGQDGVGILDSGTSGNVVLGNLIGTDVHGTAKLGNSNDGVRLAAGATANTIGGGNVIAGNAANGVEINGSSTTGNVVLGNLIGTDKNGTASLGNSRDGVLLANSTMLNSIGGTASGAGNVIAGNGNDGVEIDDAPPPGRSSDTWFWAT